MWYWLKYRPTEQWNKSPEKVTHTYGQLIFNKGAKVNQWKMTVFWTNGPGILVIHLPKNELNLYLTLYYKINTKCIIDLKVRLRSLEKSIRKIFVTIGLAENPYDTKSINHKKFFLINENLENWKNEKIVLFKTLQRNEKIATDWEEIFVKPLSDKEFFVQNI